MTNERLAMTIQIPLIICLLLNWLGRKIIGL